LADEKTPVSDGLMFKRWCKEKRNSEVGRDKSSPPRPISARHFPTSNTTHQYQAYPRSNPSTEIQVQIASDHTMPILRDFIVPKALSDLAFPSGTNTFFIAFLASKDPQTNKPWCPDVVAALPTLESTFTGASKPQVAFVNVGQRPE
jgi:hypothetical protein